MKTKNESTGHSITTVFFDVGGVMAVDFIKKKILDLTRKYHLDEGRMLDAWARLRPLADLGQMSDPGFWTAVLKENGIEADDGDLRIDSYMEEIEGMREMVAAINGSGRRTAILSNDSHEMSRMRRDLFGFDNLFSDIVLSCDHGLMKPDPRFYKLALRRLETPAEQAIFVDDNQINVDPARALGMHAFLFRGAEDFRSILERFDIAL